MDYFTLNKYLDVVAAFTYGFCYLSSHSFVSFFYFLLN